MKEKNKTKQKQNWKCYRNEEKQQIDIKRRKERAIEGEDKFNYEENQKNSYTYEQREKKRD